MVANQQCPHVSSPTGTNKTNYTTEPPPQKNSNKQHEIETNTLTTLNHPPKLLCLSRYVYRLCQRARCPENPMRKHHQKTCDTHYTRTHTGDKVVLIEDETPNGSTTVSEERRPPTIIQAGGGIVGSSSGGGPVVVGSRRRPLSSRISKANRDLHASPDMGDPSGHGAYSQVDQYDDADVGCGYYDEDDRDS